MCGIVGYIGTEPAAGIVLPGLRRLEYRGYDSAGIATVDGGRLARVRAVGKLSSLERALQAETPGGTLGIGHTRWATHGPPTECNAHPHTDPADRIALVHNGIIENYRALREALSAEGAVFHSQTDTEVLAHLVAKHYTGDLGAAVRAALAQARGAYAIAVIAADDPETLVAARHGSPLLLGVVPGGWVLASDAPALLPVTREVIYLEEGDSAVLTRAAAVIYDAAGAAVTRPAVTITWNAEAAERDGYPHFMLKEIHQQPDVVRHALTLYAPPGEGVCLPDLALSDDTLRGLRRVVIVACGTAWHAALIAKYWLEQWARLPVEVDFASEFRYREPVLDSDTLVIAISQSGETADTLEAVRLARPAGAPVLGIINVVGSSIARLADGLVYTVAGPEIGVASTKAYTAQLMALALFAIHTGRVRGTLGEMEAAELLAALHAIPPAMERCLAAAGHVAAFAADTKYRDATHAMFIGRSYNYPSALEGALKLKEISYIHVEGYGAGEMKHGPIALVTDHLPVVCIAVQGRVYEKVLSNIEEIRARGGIVLAIGTEGDSHLHATCDDFLAVPASAEAFSPLVVAVPLQLFAYHVAVNLGRDVDQPRNLAKSVTVE